MSIAIPPENNRALFQGTLAPGAVLDSRFQIIGQGENVGPLQDRVMITGQGMPFSSAQGEFTPAPKGIALLLRGIPATGKEEQRARQRARLVLRERLKVAPEELETSTKIL